MILLLLALALAPGLAIAIYIYWRDKYEKEPIGLLVACFILGGLTCIPAALAEHFSMKFLSIDLDSPHTDLFTAFYAAFFLVGFSEEFVKYLVLTKYAFRKPAFNEPFDGIVYSVIIGLGFATLENIFYVIEGGLSTGIARMFTAVPMHAVFGVLMGYYVGMAKFQGTSLQLTSKLKGLGFAVIFHGAYDFFLFQDVIPWMKLLIVPMIVCSILISRKAMRVNLAASPFNK
jgi:RsiW-degrading membrane proteinase PrsW (M82 family)